MGTRVELEAFFVFVVLFGFEHFFELLGQLGMFLQGGLDVVQKTVCDLAQAIDLEW